MQRWDWVAVALQGREGAQEGAQEEEGPEVPWGQQLAQVGATVQSPTQPPAAPDAEQGELLLRAAARRPRQAVVGEGEEAVESAGMAQGVEGVGVAGRSGWRQAGPARPALQGDQSEGPRGLAHRCRDSRMHGMDTAAWAAAVGAWTGEMGRRTQRRECGKGLGEAVAVAEGKPCVDAFPGRLNSTSWGTQHSPHVEIGACVAVQRLLPD